MQTMRDNETFCINSLQNFYSEMAHLHGRTRCKQNETNCEKKREIERESQFGHVDTNDYPVATLQKEGILRIRIEKCLGTDYKKRCILLGRNEKRNSLAN